MSATQPQMRIADRIKARALDRWIHVFGWAFVGVIGFVLGSFVAGQAYLLIVRMGLSISPQSPVGQLVLGGVIYGCTVILLVCIAAYRHARFSSAEIGMSRLLEWKDISFAIVGAPAYILLTYVGLQLAMLVPGFDATQSQSVNLGPLYGVNHTLAFLSLVVVTPLVEEVIFRGMIYGRMRRTTLPWWIPAIVVSIVFGVVHLQWNVGIDVFCLSLVLCTLREVTGSIWAGVIVHMLKNAVAFFVMFGLWG